MAIVGVRLGSVGGGGGTPTQNIDIDETQVVPGNSITVQQLPAIDYTAATTITAVFDGIPTATPTVVDADTLTVVVPGTAPLGVAKVLSVDADGVIGTDTIETIATPPKYLDDDCTGTPGTDVFSRAPDGLGPTPTLIGTGTVQINASEQMEAITAGAGFNSPSVVYGDPINFLDGYFAEGEFVVVAGATHSLGIDIKIIDTSNRINFSVQNGNLRLRRVQGGETNLDTGSAVIATGTPYVLRVTYDNAGDIDCYIDDVLVLSGTDSTFSTNTNIGFRLGLAGDTVDKLCASDFP